MARRKSFEFYVRWSVAMLLLLSFSMNVGAVPAKPGLTRVLKLTDGTTVTARLVGDEHGHYWLAENGSAYLQKEGTDLFQLADATAIKTKAKLRRQKANSQHMKRLSPKKVGTVGNYTGQKKGLVILVNFSGSSFKSSNNVALYERIANEPNFSYGSFKGSMYDYFYAQSEGQFELTFDIVGPVTVSKSASYYGSNDYQGNDKYPGTMVVEAVNLADEYVDYSDYDWDGDGKVDQVYVIYAGKGEADGGSSSTIWPHAWTLSEAAYSGDGSGPVTLDGVTVDTYACGPELDGTSGTIAGIGTMCHEFSHCLGYPDFYDIDYSGGQGMGNWDLMDSGSYNGDGYQPAGYTSYERWVAGWKEPIELTTTTTVENLKALQNGGSGYIVYNKGNQNEYFLLENRQKVGWDASIPGAGLLILHVDYNESIWESNQPNDDPNHQRMTWIPADNKYQYTTYQGKKYYSVDGMVNDPFPYGSVNSFSKSSTPAAKFYNKNIDGTYYLDSSIEQITQNSDGTISFKFMGVSNVSMPKFTPNAGVYSESQDVTITCDTEGATIYYTTDGTEPTTSSTEYTAPITVETTTTIKAIAFKDGEQSDVATAKYTIRSNNGTIATTYKRVTAISEMESGKNYIIACGSKKTAAGALNNTYLNSVTVTENDDIITINDDVTVFILEGSGSNYTIMNQDGEYLYASEAKKLAYGQNEATWTLSDGDNGVIMSYGNYGTMRYNSTSPRFTTYTSNPSASMINANLYMEYEETPPTPDKTDITLTFSEEELEGVVGEDFTEPRLIVEPAGVAITVTYTTSDADVATVDETTGEVTLVGEGDVSITASFAGDDLYNAAEAFYSITVVKAPEPEYVSVEVGETGYTTLYYGEVSLIVPEGVTAYTCYVDGAKLEKGEYFYTSDIIPASTGVIVEAEQGAYRFQVVSSDPTALSVGKRASGNASNMLMGTDLDEMTVGADAQDYKFYKLSLPSDGGDASAIGFYYGAVDGAAFTNKAHEAYLCILAENAKEYYRLDGSVPTGINGVVKESLQKDVYSVTGIRMMAGKTLPHGLYIVNGKKVVVK